MALLCDNYGVFQERVSREELQRFWNALDRAAGAVSGLRVLLAGREAVRHCHEVRVLETGLTATALGPLTPADSDALLDVLGVNDAAFRRAVYGRLARGHPLVTRLAAEVWLETPGGLPAAQVPRLDSHDKALLSVGQRCCAGSTWKASMPC